MPAGHGKERGGLLFKKKQGADSAESDALFHSLEHPTIVPPVAFFPFFFFLEFKNPGT